MLRMIQRGEQLCLALETRQAIRVERERLGQHLDRDLASERRVAGAIHLTHAARPEKAGDLECPDARPGIQRHVTCRSCPAVGGP